MSEHPVDEERRPADTAILAFNNRIIEKTNHLAGQGGFRFARVTAVEAAMSGRDLFQLHHVRREAFGYLIYCRHIAPLHLDKSRLMLRAVNKQNRLQLNLLAPYTLTILFVNRRKGIIMELREYIEEGEKKAGGRIALANYLRLPHPNNISNAKSGQRGLPLAACYKLADLIGVPRDSVAAASALVTEKDEEVRAYLLPFVQAARHAQHLTIAITAGAIAFSLAIENSASTIRSFLLKHRLFVSAA